MRSSPTRWTVAVVKAAAVVIAVALIVVGGAVVPANAVGLFSISGHVALLSSAVSASAGEVKVYAYGGSGAWWDQNTVTDASGNYVLSGLAEGNYTLRFQYLGSAEISSEFWGHFGDSRYSDWFSLAANTTGMNTILQPRATISGVVSLGAAGVHPAGILSKVLWETDDGYGWDQGPSEGVTTDAAGNYSFRVDIGTYRFRYRSTSPDYQGRYWGGAMESGAATVLQVSGVMPAMNITLPIFGSISGHVYLGDSSASAAAGAVKVTYSVCYQVVGCISQTPPSVLTDASGNYSLTRLGKGVYSLTFEYIAGTAYQRRTGPVVTVTDSAPTQASMDVTLLPSASISGHVSLGTASTSAGTGQVTIAASGAGGAVASTAQTDAAGNYTLNGLGNGSYKVSFHYVPGGAYSDQWWQNSGSVTGSTSIYVTSTALTGYDVTLLEGASITGVLKSSAGVVQPNLLVTAHRYINGTFDEQGQYSVTSAADGSFAFTALPPGKYLLNVSDGRLDGFGLTWIADATGSMWSDISLATPLAAGQQLSLGDVVLLRHGGVFGNVTCDLCGTASEPYGVYSTLFYLDAEGAWAAAGPGSGTYIYFTPLLPGTYQLRAGVYDDSVYVPYVSEPFTLSEGEQVNRQVSLVRGGTLPIGTLVKSNAVGATTVYLVDGASKLVPVPVIATATSAGVSSTVTPVSPALLAPYSIAPALRNVVLCPYQTFFAAGGKLWYVTPSLVAGLPKTTLLSSTCNALPKSAIAIQGGLFVQSSTGPATFYITPTGEKRAISGRVSMGQLSYPYAPVVLRVENTFLNSLTTGAAVVSYFGKHPPAGAAQVPSAALVDANTAGSTLTVDQRATCYADYFQAIGVGMFAPLAQTVALDASCRQELRLELVPVG